MYVLTTYYLRNYLASKFLFENIFIMYAYFFTLIAKMFLPALLW